MVQGLSHSAYSMPQTLSDRCIDDVIFTRSSDGSFIQARAGLLGTSDQIHAGSFYIREREETKDNGERKKGACCTERGQGNGPVTEVGGGQDVKTIEREAYLSEESK